MGEGTGVRFRAGGAPRATSSSVTLLPLLSLPIPLRPARGVGLAVMAGVAAHVGVTVHLGNGLELLVDPLGHLDHPAGDLLLVLVVAGEVLGVVALPALGAQGVGEAVHGVEETA